MWQTCVFDNNDSLAYIIIFFEPMSLNKRQLLAIKHPWTRTFMKLFSTFDTNIISGESVTERGGTPFR